MAKKNKIIIIFFVFILLAIFLFSKGATSKKEFIGQKEYSVYSKSYVYSELLCVFSLFDCNKAGVIYLFDEIEGKVIESVNTGRIEAIESLKWNQSSNTIYFTALEDIVIENNEWTLPRALRKVESNIAK